MTIEPKLMMIAMACFITFLAALRPLGELFGRGAPAVLGALAVAGLAFVGLTTKADGLGGSILGLYAALALSLPVVIVLVPLVQVLRRSRRDGELTALQRRLLAARSAVLPGRRSEPTRSVGDSASTPDASPSGTVPNRRTAAPGSSPSGSPDVDDNRFDSG